MNTLEIDNMRFDSSENTEINQINRPASAARTIEWRTFFIDFLITNICAKDKALKESL